MSGILGKMMPFIGMAMQTEMDFRECYKAKRDDLIHQWELTYDMPRKMKKRERKRIDKEWAWNETLGSISIFNF